MNTTTQAKPMSFVAACKDFFGTKEGQTPLQFMKEVKELTPKDREEITEGLVKNGYEITPSNLA